MPGPRSQINSKAKLKVYDEESSDSSDHASETVYSHQEHARPRRKVEHNVLSPTTSDSSVSTSKQSLTSSIIDFRSDFDELKCKMKIFGESLNLCRCIASDFRAKLNYMERRLLLLERKQLVSRNVSNYSAIIQKNKRLSHITLVDAKRLQMCKTDAEKREIAARICRNYLHGAWKTIDSNLLVFRRMSGGLSNILYFLALPENFTMSNTARDFTISADLKASSANTRVLRSSSYSMIEEPRNVLLRIYGQISGEKAMDSIVTESVIFTLLSERRLGPKLHGVFSGGRIEEFLPARCLKSKELREKALSLKIAEKMAAIHSMDVPLNKEPTWMWNNFRKWVKTLKDEKILDKYQPKTDEESRILRELKDIDLFVEIEWLKKYLAKFNSVVVFCHNDLQEGNILILDDKPVPFEDENLFSSVSESAMYSKTCHENNESTIEESDICDSIVSNTCNWDPQLFLIDFEYCAYNYRGFDIANHFQEWMFDYTNKNNPFYHMIEENLPTIDQKNLFIYHYLKHYEANTSEESDSSLPTQKAVDQLREEVDAFAMACHMFWSLWSFVNATKGHIPFGYWDYGFRRFEYYKKLKVDALISENSKS